MVCMLYEYYNSRVTQRASIAWGGNKIAYRLSLQTKPPISAILLPMNLGSDKLNMINS